MKILRFYTSNTDKIKHTSAYEAIAFAAKRYGLAGATVYKGIMGYGTSSVLSFVKFCAVNEKIPVIVEIVDEDDKISSFLEKIVPVLEKMPKGCLITCQSTEVVLLKTGTSR